MEQIEQAGLQQAYAEGKVNMSEAKAMFPAKFEGNRERAVEVAAARYREAKAKRDKGSDAATGAAT